MPSNTPIEPTRADRERAEHCLRIPRDPHPIRVDIVAHWSATGEWPRQVDFESPLVRDTIREHESVAQTIAEAREAGRFEGDRQQALSLLNTLGLAEKLIRKLRRSEPVTVADMQHFVRFCAESGIKTLVLRDEAGR